MKEDKERKEQGSEKERNVKKTTTSETSGDDEQAQKVSPYLLIEPSLASVLYGMLLGRKSCRRRHFHNRRAFHTAAAAAAAAPVPKLSSAVPCAQESSAQHEEAESCG